jgi:hypothetical protein
MPAFSVKPCTTRALVPYFNDAGWYWGGGYHNPNRKDAMHFECGLALLQSFGL